MPDGRQNPQANRPQCEFLALPNKYRAFVGGYGSSKTWTGCMAICIHALEHPGINQGYFAPTYAMIRDIFYPTIEEVAASFGLQTATREGNKEVDLFWGGRFRCTVLCRSMEKPETIVGFKIGHAVVDEFDMIEPRKAEIAWRKIIARMRYNDPTLKNGVDVATTPEGFRATHKLFVQAPQENPALLGNYGLLQASTYENELNLPADYIPSLIETYPKELITAYILGKFVNLRSGTIYRSYDRIRCNSTETIRAANGDIPAEPLYIGMDFNVMHMAATVYVKRPSGWHAVAELKDVFDTPDIIRIIIDRWKSKGHPIVIYPDPSGKNREALDASRSDVAMLTAARFTVRAHSRNPAVKDRINATNRQFEKAQLWVNARECPTVARCLESQVYDDNGEPQKGTGYDHQNDATTYPIEFEFPIVRPTMVKMALSGW